MNKITMGQYIPGKSWIYKLDPRLKIIATLVLMICIFFLPNLLTMVVALSIFILIFISTRLSIFRIIKGLRSLLFLIIFSSLLQLIYNNEGELLHIIEFQMTLAHVGIITLITLGYFLTKRKVKYKLTYTLLFITSIFLVQNLLRFTDFNLLNYSLRIYEQGLNRAGFIILRIILMISLTTLLTLTTAPMDINIGLQSILKPLKLVKVPDWVLGSIGMMFSLTLRFIPTLIIETDKIMKAQASRGVDFDEGKLKDKITQIIALLVPIFVMSIKRAEDLADAMESRGFVIGAPRTRLDQLKFKFLDYLVLVIFLLLVATTFYVRFYVF